MAPHSFEISDEEILLNGIPLEPKMIVELLENGRIQMENMHKELKAAREGNKKLNVFKEKVNRELRIWNIEECNFDVSFRAMDNIENIILSEEGND